jgi:hypothetical protein
MCFGGDDDDKTTTVVQSSSLPPYVVAGAEENFNRAKALADRPYPPYGGPRLADFSADTTGGMQSVRNAVGSWRPGMDHASGAARGLTMERTDPRAFQTAERVARASLPQETERYLNPHVGFAVDELNRQADIERRRLSQRAAASGAHGDARHGVLESNLNRNLYSAVGRLMSDTYTGAQQAALADRQSNLQGANAWSSMALADRAQSQAALDTFARMIGARQQFQQQDASSLFGIGAAEEAKQQQGLDLAYTDYLRQLQWPVEMLNLRTATLAGNPYDTSRMQTTTGPAPNNSAANLGAFASLIGAAGLAGGKNGFGFWGT